MYRSPARIRSRYKSLVHEKCHGLFKRERSIRPRDRNLLMEVLKSILADVLPGTVADHEQLGRGNAAASDSWEEVLSHDGRQSNGQFLPDRRLSYHRE